ncbi:PEP/pyruvate-binding domain-containing protein [[Pseudopropionibacterium] massiliense]|uniref:PEP/pyruvate-binding domain-containing protein n=1 Tax=[Pseudopropionibacterium] massiliense TaxID=2220000 RepID=UPI00102F5392|nr:PEP/pyruvate-binding domain-containing protein [[Pseudopropionibacterium] massiliense]
MMRETVGTAAQENVVPLGEGVEMPSRLEQLGGKGASLDLLTAWGLPVPSGFCVTSGLLRGGLDEKGRTLVLEAYRRLGNPVVAVRSSAPGEDGRTKSAAGIHETVLGVSSEKELLDAIASCVASERSERADAYYRNGAEPAGMAVVVQEMVDARTSGVLFTVDPLEPESGKMVVEASWGAGEGVVQGHVVVDRFWLDPRSGETLRAEVGEKTEKIMVRPGEGPVAVGVDREHRREPSLSDEERKQLCSLARQVRERFEAPVDIEFCVDQEGIRLLQARNVTTVDAHSRGLSPYEVAVSPGIRAGTMWSRMDIGEIFNGMMTPMGLSFARYYQYWVHCDCVRATGIADCGKPELHMGYLRGYVYLNISYTARMLQQSLATRNQSTFTERFRSCDTANEMYSNPFGESPGVTESVKGAVYWVLSTLRETASMRSRARRLEKWRREVLRSSCGEDLSVLSRGQLGVKLEEALEAFHKTHVGYMPYYLNAAGVYQLLAKLGSTWLGGASVDDLVHGVKADMSALRTVRTAGDLAVLARKAQKIPAVSQILQAGNSSHLLEALSNDVEGRRFIKSHVEEFLREHGTRGRQEMELSRPRWLDDPTYVLTILSAYLTQPGLLETVEHHVNDRRNPVDILKRLPRHRALVLGAVVRAYTEFSRLREVTRMPMVTAIWLIRRIVVECARRAAADGFLNSADEIWLLNFEDFRRCLANEAAWESFFSPEAVERGRAEYERNLRGPEPPLTIIGTWDGSLQGEAGESAGSSRDVLTGLGTSPGVVEGRARVVVDLDSQAGEMQAGEILVTTFTDASWTPLFAMAAGVVADTGSLLSHSSIVARELGVPSVVNTHSGTSWIRTGDRIRVDGVRGVVEILGSGEEEERERR